MTAHERAAAAIKRINDQIEVSDPSHVFALFSGGDDSLTATWIASQAKQFDGAVHIDTGTGIKATREFVEQSCDSFGWPLKIYEAGQNRNGKGDLDPQDYAAIVREYGFPGPAGHGIMYARLKERALRMLCREHKTRHRDKIMLISGCRREESERRMGTTKEFAQEGCRLWMNPLWGWTKTDCLEYLTAEDVARNPVVLLLHRSGECNCGAFAKEGELKEMLYWYPEMAWIKDLEEEVRSVMPWGWGERPPADRKCKRFPKTKSPGPLCSGCSKTEVRVG